MVRTIRQKNTKNRILVTGGAGFVGSHLVDTLVKNNDVTVIDNLSSGKREFVSSKAGFIEEDVTDRKAVLKNVKDFDFVFHLAANPEVRIGVENPSVPFEQNILGTYNILEAMRLNGIKNIAFTSTSTVYGEAKQIPTQESHTLAPISLYGASKVAAESLISAYCHSFGIRSWIFRFANIVGPKGTHGVVYDFIRKLEKNPNELEVLGDGNQSKSYIYVDDCVDAMLFAIKKSSDKVNIFNIGTEDQISAKRIAELVISEMGLNSKISYTGGIRGWVGDVPYMLLDISKLKSLGWELKRNSEDSIKSTIKNLLKE